MFELHSDRGHSPSVAERTGGHARDSSQLGARYVGPERRHCHKSPVPWVFAALDEIDYGLLLLDQQRRMVHANQAATVLLEGDYPLMLVGRSLHARNKRDVTELNAAIQGAAVRGLRKLLRLGSEPSGTSVSVVPLREFGDAFVSARSGAQDGSAVLLMLGKQPAGNELALECFARTNGLSPTEVRVLKALCIGLQPSEVANRHGVAMSTVRTQIGNVRAKTGTASIRDLLRRVAELPPLQGVLRR